MSFRAMTANEWQLWPDRENCTLRVQTALGVFDSFRLAATGGAVKRRAITWKEMTASAGAYQNRDRAWLIPRVNLPPDVKPQPGYVVRDSDGTDWTIGDVTIGKFGNTFKCVCRALALVHELTALGQLSRPSSGQDAAGRMAQTDYADIGTAIRCRVQPQEATAGDVFERRTMTRTFTAYLESFLRVQARDVFTVTTFANFGGAATGTTAYTVTGSRNSEQVWGLPELSLELIA